MSEDILERLRDYKNHLDEHLVAGINPAILKLVSDAAAEIERMRDALKLIGLRNHPTSFTDETDWHDVANCMVGIARQGLGEDMYAEGRKAADKAVVALLEDIADQRASGSRRSAR